MPYAILGTGCAKCKTLYRDVEEVLNERRMEAKLVKIEDIGEILKYGVMSLPAIVIDGKVAMQGGRLSKDEIAKILGK